MEAKKLNVSIEGLTPLLMHNAQLANPFNEYTMRIKELTAKKNKMTDSEREALRRLEWEGGMYLGADETIVMPGLNLSSMVIGGAKKSRKGTEFKAGIDCGTAWPLKYPGDRLSLDELYEDKNYVHSAMVTVQRNKVLRTWPKFNIWSLEFVITYWQEVVNKKDIVTALEKASMLVGLGDYRPTYGRFKIKNIT